MNKDSKFYLRDILAALDSIEHFVGSMNFEEFKTDDKTASAVIRKFEIIGEATKKIPEDLRIQYPGIPWKEMAGMRDRLIHLYMDVDIKIVWDTIKNRLPDLKGKIQKALKQNGG